MEIASFHQLSSLIGAEATISEPFVASDIATRASDWHHFDSSIKPNSKSIQSKWDYSKSVEISPLSLVKGLYNYSRQTNLYAQYCL